MLVTAVQTSFLTTLFVLSLVPLFSHDSHQPKSQVNLPMEVAQTPTQNNLPVAEIARQATVRILSSNGAGAGSGVIIGRQGQVYTAITCAHVVGEGRVNRHTILTVDGRTYAGSLPRSVPFGDKDLALVQFTSNDDYQVVEMGDSDSLSIGDRVYSAGFPNWNRVSRDEIEDTRGWGVKAFRLTRGSVGMIAERSLPRGYQLGYTNEVQDGMSGGPVLNGNGELVGINGRLKFTPQGIQVYRFADGTAPSNSLFKQMEALSWAIPSSAFQRIVR